MSMDKKILVVEDEKVVVDSARKILSLDNLELESAANVPDAVSMLKENQDHYTMVITDLMLPKISGMEFLKTVKGLYPDIPIIVFTGYATTDKAIQAITEGAFDFLPKPFSIEELSGVVRRCLKYLEMQSNGELLKKIENELSGMKEKEKVFYFGEHSWAKSLGKGSLQIGMGKTFYNLLGNIIEIEFPSINEEINQGNSCVRIISENDSVNIVRMPVSGIIAQYNPRLEKEKNLVQTDPFHEGWLVKVSPTNLAKDGAAEQFK